jgi:hypothetical protein
MIPRTRPTIAIATIKPFNPSRRPRGGMRWPSRLKETEVIAIGGMRRCKFDSLCRGEPRRSVRRVDEYVIASSSCGIASSYGRNADVPIRISSRVPLVGGRQGCKRMQIHALVKGDQWHPEPMQGRAGSFVVGHVSNVPYLRFRFSGHVGNVPHESIHRLRIAMRYPVRTPAPKGGTAAHAHVPWRPYGAGRAEIITPESRGSRPWLINAAPFGARRLGS